MTDRQRDWASVASMLRLVLLFAALVYVTLTCTAQSTTWSADPWGAEHARAEQAALSQQYDCWTNDGRPHPIPGGALEIHGMTITHTSDDVRTGHLLDALLDGKPVPHLAAFCRR